MKIVNLDRDFSGLHVVQIGIQCAYLKLEEKLWYVPISGVDFPEIDCTQEPETKT